MDEGFNDPSFHKPLEEYVTEGSRRMALRRERVAFLRWNPEQAGAADVRFLAASVQRLEEYLNDLYAAGALRPRHEWHVWHDDINEQLRLNRQAFLGE